jgi:hypothetical protein
VAEGSADEVLAGLLDTVSRLESGPVVDGPELLVALAGLRRLRDQLTAWEPALIGAAREQGVTWMHLAPALGLASRQAAERRYLRLNPGDGAGTTREGRVQATRDRRSGDRAVAVWARDNAADLRRVAGQIAALSDQGEALDRPARDSVARVHAALGVDDAADLVAPLAEAGSALSSSHPDLAGRISALTASAAQVRTADFDRRNVPVRTDRE